MKSILLTASLVVVSALTSTAQDNSLAQQNPSYMVSQARYMKMADSINSWHGTTIQDTYKAIDYLEDKREQRANRRAWRHELRMERARNSGWYNNGYYNDYYPSYGNGYYYNRPWGYRNNRNNWDNYLWNTLPLAATIGLWWCR
ncbi:hypothetical protein HB364_05745 [Pseudoflavitalea sp. X16]|uniref:hypothetical protein n=1 Tax=Paraflavitalea devenefica TaxID=2716334 RepID=UPI00141F64F5|nr:hypothetical protein [Paraflavitalea devenefica]NII24568.1 hypothetical protein [Paraflavitalea devenefica]